MIDLHKICQTPTNCQCKWLLARLTARETFVNSFPFSRCSVSSANLGGARAALMRFTLPNDASRKTFSFPNLCGAKCLWRIWRPVLIPLFLDHLESIFSDKNLEIHNPIVQTPSTMQRNLSHNFSSTFCWASHQPQHALRNMFFHICIRSQTCSFETREDTKIYMTGFLTKPVSAWNFAPFVWRDFLFVAWCFRGVFVSLRQSWPSNLVRERTIVFFVWKHRHCFQGLIDDWNCTSLLSNIVHLFSTESILPLSSRRRLSFLFDSWSLLLSQQLRSGLWSVEFSSFDE